MMPTDARAPAAKKPFPFAVRVEAKAPVRFEDRLERIATPLRALDSAAARAKFVLAESQTLLKTTISVCPMCTRHVPAAVFVERGRVFMKKQCADHGDSLALLENDVRYYRLASKDKWGRRYADAPIVELPAFDGGCCGPGQSCSTSSPGSGERNFSDQQVNKSCTVLVEVTDACNLACRVCYADSKGDRLLPLDRFRSYLDKLLAAKGSLDSVQLIGGEATIHPQFWDMLAYLHAEGRIRKIYIATNGIELERAIRPRDSFRSRTRYSFCCSSMAPTRRRIGRYGSRIRFGFASDCCGNSIVTTCRCS